jgi:hypothetical protein
MKLDKDIWIIPVLRKRPTGAEIMDYVNDKIGQRMEYKERIDQPLFQTVDVLRKMNALMEYLSLEFKEIPETPAKLTVVKKKEQEA